MDARVLLLQAQHCAVRLTSMLLELACIVAIPDLSYAVSIDDGRLPTCFLTAMNFFSLQACPQHNLAATTTTTMDGAAGSDEHKQVDPGGPQAATDGAVGLPTACSCFSDAVLVLCGDDINNTRQTCKSTLNRHKPPRNELDLL